MIGPNLWFYQLLLVALVLICLMIHIWWPTAPSPTSKTPLKPDKPRRKRAKEPTPFAGLIHKPVCAACQQAVDSHPKVPATPPPLMTFRRGRRRIIETQQQFCPDHDCPYYGWLGRGNIRANGHPGGSPWRQLQCVSCHGYFHQLHGTPLHSKRVSLDKLVWAVSALAEGLGMRAVARGFAVAPNTVLQWLVEAAEHLEAFSGYFLHDLPVEQVQMDELFALLSAVTDGETTEAKAIKRLSRSPHWVWVAMAPVSKLILAWDTGDRTLAMAQRLVHHVAQVLVLDCTPLFLTAGLRESLTALVTHYGQWTQPERRQSKGPRPKPRWMPKASLLYAQVVKSSRRRRIVGGTHRVVFGAPEVIHDLLDQRGWKINSAFVERLNLDLRQHVAAIGRRVKTLCKHEDGLRHQLAVLHAYHNFVLPHARLRLALPETSDENGSGTRWQPRTPAMAGGLTDHIWSLREV